MNKRVMTPVTQSVDYFGLIICGALFICGCIAGTAAAKLAAVGGFSDYLSGYLSLMDGLKTPVFFSSLWNACKYHLAVVFFGLSILGVILLPALSAVRGFLLSFSISAIIRHFGSDGVLLALTIFGVNSLISIPCFFVLSIQSFSASLYLLRSVTARGARSVFPPYGFRFFKRLCLCFAALSCSALIDTFLISKLISFIAERLG